MDLGQEIVQDIAHVMVLVDSYPLSSTCDPQVCLEKNWHDLMLHHATSLSVSLPITLSRFSFLDRTRDLDLLIYISNLSPLSRQSLLTILLFIVSSFSKPSTYSNLGTFLVCHSIVLSLRKAPIGLVYSDSQNCPNVLHFLIVH